MLRLVQGDVGAGKTLVAAVAACHALEEGWQVALMAPTEILAEQHYLNFQKWFEPLGLTVAWLSGKQKGKARAAAEQAFKMVRQFGGWYTCVISGQCSICQIGFSDY